MELSEIQQIALGGLEGTVRELRTPLGLVLTEARFEFGAAKVSTEPFALALASPGVIEARVSAESLEAFLNEKQPGGARDFEVRLEGGLARIAATARALLEVRVVAACTLRIEEGKRLCVAVESASLMGLSSGSIVQRQIEAANPIVDVAGWPVEVTLDSVEIRPDAVCVRGKVWGARVPER